MPWLSTIARHGKCRFFLSGLPKDSRILEVGCGDGWAGRYLCENGWMHYTGMDLHPPADIVGDIRNWRDLGIRAGAFDAVLAFEVVEHVDCFQAMYDVLAPGGLLMITSPHPRWDWLCRMLEGIGLTQRRSSPHSHLIDFRDVPLFERVNLRRSGLAAQWGIFRKPRGSL